eukprot:c17345_g1_i1.p2 GENE.c17345_g1_i1~~c17345_g1_i1.p2  ORF type:complete len:127 (-),score=11.33 c17345_g1_i1:530-910(-)
MRGYASESSCGWKGENMPPVMDWALARSKRPAALQQHIADVSSRLLARGEKKMASMYETCTCLTMDTAMHRMSSSENHNREETFVATGDIPDMWLRDSSGQIRPYAALATADEALQDVLEGFVGRG